MIGRDPNSDIVYKDKPIQRACSASETVSRIPNMNHDTVWQKPHYTLRRSKRAKRLSLRITPSKGLEIVVPERMGTATAERHISALLQQQQQWIDNQFQRFQLPRDRAAKDILPLTVPTELYLLALDETWQIETTAYLGKARFIERQQHTLVLLHDYNRPQDCFQLLQAWLRDKASDVLLPWLRRESEQCNLPYQTAKVRAQSGRWGSCSDKKAISINYKLLFFPPEVVRYILVHELCHTLHMNHSTAFWQLVEQHDPQYRRHDRVLKKEREYIPRWL